MRLTEGVDGIVVDVVQDVPTLLCKPVAEVVQPARHGGQHLVDVLRRGILAVLTSSPRLKPEDSLPRPDSEKELPADVNQGLTLHRAANAALHVLGGAPARFR